MAIDPFISLRGRGVEMFNPVTQFKAARAAAEERELRLRDLLNSQKLREMQMRAQQEALERERGFRQALSGGANYEMLSQIDPERAAEWQAQRAAAEESRRKVALAKLTRLGQIAGSIRSEADFGPGVQQMVAEGLVAPEQAQVMAQTPWAEAQVELQRLARQSMTVAEQLSQQDKEAAAQRAEAQARQQRNQAAVSEMNQTATRMETERHNRELEAASERTDRRLRNEAGVKEMQEQYDRLNPKPRTLVPGRDIPYPPEVEAQRRRMAQDGAGSQDKAAAKREEAIRQAEAEKEAALRKAEQEYAATKDTDFDAGSKLRAKKRDIQFKYEQAIIRAGGRITGTWNPDDRPSSAAPASEQRPPAAPAAQPQRRITAFNPKTGEQIELVNGQWVPLRK